MGILLPDDEKYVKQELEKLKKKLQKNKKILYLQLGFINEFATFKNEKKLSQEFKDEIKQKRIAITTRITQTFGLKESFRENMPVSDIVYDIQKSNEVLLEEMHDSCKTKVKRAMNKKISFKRISTLEEKEKFYQDWADISKKKGFGIIPKEQYQKLLDFIEKEHKGEVFVTELDGDIVGGSICIYTKDTLTYLYGFGNRKYQNIGGHHFLKFKIFEYAREHGLHYVDAMGGAPTGFPEHHLKGVSDFKESL